MARYFGHIDVSVTFAAFVVAMALLLQRENPRFAQLSSAVFGLFYCGYLPCFWVKLRCGLAAPALNTSKKLGIYGYLVLNLDFKEILKNLTLSFFAVLISNYAMHICERGSVVTIYAYLWKKGSVDCFQTQSR